MQTLTITKWDIVRALETEPLTWGCWAETGKAVNDPTCRVCAVGAAVRLAAQWRRVKARHDTHAGVCMRATDGRANPGSRAPAGNWLSALSIVWETLNCNNWVDSETGKILDPEDLRPDIVRWAQDNIPDSYRATIPVY